MNIRLRLTLWYTAIFSLILVIFSIVVYVGLTRSLLNTVDNHLQREVAGILGSVEFESEDHGDDDAPDSDHESGLYLEYEPEDSIYWRILNAEGQAVIDPDNLAGVLQDMPTLSLTDAQSFNAILADGTPLRIYSAPFSIEGQGNGIIQVAESYRHIQEVQRQLLLLLALGLPVTMLASSAGGWFLAANALAPIDRITRTAQQISANDLHQRLNLTLPQDEVGRLAATFDQMLTRLESAFEQQKRFIADASHEMRTPLTILKGDVEVALNRPRSAESYRQTLELVDQTTDRLTALVRELFELARVDNQQTPLQLEQIELTSLLCEQLDNLLPRARAKNIALNLEMSRPLTIYADKAKLVRIFTNLIDNAIKYSDEFDAIEVRAISKQGLAYVTVADNGPGIPPEHLPHIFERFYRVDQARSRSTADILGSGAGLGLSLVYELVVAHGGSVKVSSKVGEGTIFTVQLPLNLPPL